MVSFSVGLRDLQAELAKEGKQWSFSNSELIYDEENNAVQYGHYAFMFQENAQKALRTNDIVSFWRYLAAAKHWELAAWEELRGPGSQQLRFRAQQVLLEATDALGPERNVRIEELLVGEDALVKENVGYNELYAATHLLHQQYIEDHQTNRRLQIFERQFLSFIVTTVVALVGILSAFAISPVDTASVTSVLSLTTAVLFGVLGASVSGLLSLTDVLGRERVPEHVTSYWLTIGRIVVGAAAALTLVVFLLSGILDQFIRIGTPTISSIFAVAFLGGFSERLLPRAVETVVDSTS